MIIIRKIKLYSEDNREIVSSSVAEEGKRSGVIQKKPNGKWGIISYKSDPPEWWDANYDSKKDAQSALNGYWANKN